MARLIIATLLIVLTACATQSPTSQQPAVLGVEGGAAIYARDALEAIDAGDYDGAIELAERGLRINRYAPGLYLLLAQAYEGLGEREQARNFARLGLRYAGSDATLLAPLQQLAQP